MTDLTPNHPAVEAAHGATRAWMADLRDELPDDLMVYVLTAALPHLTADDLRDTPAGRTLMAEAWEQGWLDRRQYDQDINWRTVPTTDTNPYREGDA